MSYYSERQLDFLTDTNLAVVNVYNIEPERDVKHDLEYFSIEVYKAVVNEFITDELVLDPNIVKGAYFSSNNLTSFVTWCFYVDSDQRWIIRNRISNYFKKNELFGLSGTTKKNGKNHKNRLNRLCCETPNVILVPKQLGISGQIILIIKKIFVQSLKIY